MRYALIDEGGIVAAVAELDNPDAWLHPDDMDVVEADGFEPDPSRPLMDYIYRDGSFILDEEGIARREAERTLTTEEVLTVMFAAAPETMQALPDEALARMAPYMEEWSPDAAYKVGDLRSYQEVPYRCLQAHQAQETWNPADAPSLWAKVLIPDPSVIPEWEQPSSTNPYMKGDKVKHNGKTWESLIDNNVWEPSESVPTLWIEIGD